MTYTQHYDSPLGGILLAADEEGLTGLWFDGQKYFARTLPKEYAESETPVLREAKRWLDIYFSGREPDFTPPLHPVGSAFRQAVWALLMEIPYGETTTYGALARKLIQTLRQDSNAPCMRLAADRHAGGRAQTAVLLGERGYADVAVLLGLDARQRLGRQQVQQHLLRCVLHLMSFQYVFHRPLACSI